MKKLTIIIVALIFVTVGCKRPKDCNYYMEDTPQMVYNLETDECDCLPFTGIESLSSSYNDWKDVVSYMRYMVRADKRATYPYYDREGDTVKVCGWIDHDGENTLMCCLGDSLQVQFTISGDSLTAFSAGRLTSPNHIEGPLDMFEGVDRERKCYITGIITFHPNSIGWEYSPGDMDPSHNCTTPNFALRMIEIKNQ